MWMPFKAMMECRRHSVKRMSPTTTKQSSHTAISDAWAVVDPGETFPSLSWLTVPNASVVRQKTV